jgi:hypothetical protein
LGGRGGAQARNLGAGDALEHEVVEAALGVEAVHAQLEELLVDVDVAALVLVDAVERALGDVLRVELVVAQALHLGDVERVRVLALQFVLSLVSEPANVSE